MNYSLAGPAPSQPSRDEPRRMDSTKGYGFNQYPAARVYDPASGNMVEEMSRKDAFREIYDLNHTSRVTGSLRDSYPMEMLDFPDVFDLPDMADKFISRLNARHLWPMDMMPLLLTDQLDLAFNEVIYNDTSPDKIPEEGVPTVVTMQSYKHEDSMVRWAKGAKMERNAYLTMNGRRSLYVAHLSHISCKLSKELSSLCLGDCIGFLDCIEHPKVLVHIIMRDPHCKLRSILGSTDTPREILLPLATH